MKFILLGALVLCAIAAGTALTDDSDNCGACVIQTDKKLCSTRTGDDFPIADYCCDTTDNTENQCDGVCITYDASTIGYSMCRSTADTVSPVSTYDFSESSDQTVDITASNMVSGDIAIFRVIPQQGKASDSRRNL